MSEDQWDDDPGGERSADREHCAEDESDLCASGRFSGHSHSGLSEQSSVRTAAAAQPPSGEDQVIYCTDAWRFLWGAVININTITCHLSVCCSFYTSFILSITLFIYLSIIISLHSSFLSVYLSFFYPLFYWSVDPSLSIILFILFIYLYIHHSVHHSISLSIHCSIYFCQSFHHSIYHL